MARRYQVPNKTLGDFKIDTDSVYTRTLELDQDEQLQDVNFGALASCDETPLASGQAAGGVKLLEQTAFGDSRDYALQLSTIDGVDGYAYVSVPWTNTWYEVDGEELVLEHSDEAQLQSDGPVQLKIGAVPVSKIPELDGKVAVSSEAQVADAVCRPLSDYVAAVSAQLDSAITSNFQALDEARKQLSSHVAYVSASTYAMDQTSSEAQIREGIGAATTSLSSTIVSYLNNSLETGKRTNPAYLTGETSSSYELDEAFAKKQDALDVRDTVAASYSAGSDVPTVAAVRAYVNSSVNSVAATFQGSFQSWSAVPSAGNSSQYLDPTPDKNDYVYVYLDSAASNELGLGTAAAGTWRFTLAADSWDSSLGRNNWKPQYKIADTLFTAAQQAALDSGVTSALVAKISQLETEVARLAALLSGMQRQTWTFEQLDAAGSPLQKTILAEDL